MKTATLPKAISRSETAMDPIELVIYSSRYVYDIFWAFRCVQTMEA